jgi:hypothetical protein
MLKFIDNILLKIIAWLYLKHTIISLKIQVNQLKNARPYPAPDLSHVESSLKEFGVSYEEMKKTHSLSRVI